MILISIALKKAENNTTPEKMLMVIPANLAACVANYPSQVCAAERALVPEFHAWTTAPVPKLATTLLKQRNNKKVSGDRGSVTVMNM